MSEGGRKEGGREEGYKEGREGGGEGNILMKRVYKKKQKLCAISYLH